MSFTKKVEFSNFTLKFGEKYVLLDMFEDVVWPSFSDEENLRISRDSQYFFLDVKLAKVSALDGNKYHYVTGRFVKNTKLKREQIYTDEGIVADYEELDSAPTSIFVLLLENHRLLYVREAKLGPGLSLCK